MKILITGGAGFIGNAVATRLASDGHEVIAIDNINAYYDPALKIQRLRNAGFSIDPNWPTTTATPCSGSSRLPVEHIDIPWGITLRSSRWKNLSFVRLDISNINSLSSLFDGEKPRAVVNMAAQAGVRYSIENPLTYGQTNLMGFLNILECCRLHGAERLVYASSSSVYGSNSKIPFSETDNVDNPVSLYAATKKSNELMASVYSSLYGLSTTGLRFFTVYGPWGRPDMAPMLFSDAILGDRAIKVFNNGDLSRDFTYIDDIVEGVVRVLTAKSPGNNRIYNIGRGKSERLMDFISLLESNLGRKATLEFLPMQPGDVKDTLADTSLLSRDFGYSPSISLDEGIARFAKWILEYKHRQTES